MNKAILLLFVIFSTLLLVGCGSQKEADAATEAAAPTDTSSDTSSDAGDLDVNDLDSLEQDLATDELDSLEQELEDFDW